MKRIVTILVVLFVLPAQYAFSTTVTGFSSGTFSAENDNAMTQYYSPYDYSYSCGFLGASTCHETRYFSGSSGGGIDTGTTSFGYLRIDTSAIPTGAALLSATVDWSSTYLGTTTGGVNTSCTIGNSAFSGPTCGAFGGVAEGGDGYAIGVYDATTNTTYTPAFLPHPVDLLADGFGAALSDGDALYLKLLTDVGGYGTVADQGYNDYTSGYAFEKASFGYTASLTATYSDATGVPEPATMTLFGLGISGLAGLLRKRNKRA